MACFKLQKQKKKENLMGQVRSRTVLFDGKDYVRKTTVDKNGVFRIRIPLNARHILDLQEISAPTLKEVEKLWDQKMEEYRQANTTDRKIIYYEFESCSHILDADGDCIFESHEVGFTGGVAISLAVVVMTETKVTYPSGREFYSYKKLGSTLPYSLTEGHQFAPSTVRREDDASRILDWTSEREAFFKQIGDAIDTLILKMDGLLNNPKRLLEVADSGVPALELETSVAKPKKAKRKKGRRTRHGAD